MVQFIILFLLAIGLLILNLSIVKGVNHHGKTNSICIKYINIGLITVSILFYTFTVILAFVTDDFISEVKHPTVQSETYQITSICHSPLLWVSQTEITYALEDGEVDTYIATFDIDFDSNTFTIETATFDTYILGLKCFPHTQETYKIQFTEDTIAQVQQHIDTYGKNGISIPIPSEE